MGSPWRDKISLAILELQEKGEIQMLYDKWWKNGSDTCTMDKIKESSKANALGVDNIGGVFVVLLCGLAFSVLIAILEFFHNSRRQQKNLLYIENLCVGNSSNMAGGYKGRAIGGGAGSSADEVGRHARHGHGHQSTIVHNQSVFSDMTEELCFAFRCQGSRQRPAFKRYCVKCQQLQRNEQAATTTATTAADMMLTAHATRAPHAAHETIEMQDMNRKPYSRSMPHIVSNCYDIGDTRFDHRANTKAGPPFE